MQLPSTPCARLRSACGVPECSSQPCPRGGLWPPACQTPVDSWPAFPQTPESPPSPLPSQTSVHLRTQVYHHRQNSARPVTVTPRGLIVVRVASFAFSFENAEQLSSANGTIGMGDLSGINL